MKSKGFMASAIALAFFISIVALPASQSMASGASTVLPASTGEPWFDNRWHHRLFLTVDAGSYLRKDYPIEAWINFSSWIRSSDIIDSNSIRVLDRGVEIPSQYNPSTSKIGTVIFMMNGTTAAGAERNYTIYFDTEANGLKPVADYGDPDYVMNYKKIGTSLGSSPVNGSTDLWWFPPYLDHGKYNYHEWIIGDVKATLHAWGDGWDGSRWIRHYADSAVYRDSFVAYNHIYNNASDSEISWASGIANISTGSPDGLQWDSVDEGLTVITDDWTVHNFTTLGAGKWSDAEIMACSGPNINTYDPGTRVTHTTNIVHSTATDDYDLGSDYVLDIISVTGPGGIVPSSHYSLIQGTPDKIRITDHSGLDDGDNLVVSWREKLYRDESALLVYGKKTSTNYIITYDDDDKDEVPYARPQIGALIFPRKIAASDMVVEFWFNVTGNRGDYFINVSANYNEWWWDPSTHSPRVITPEELHDPQDNAFDFLILYMNGSANPEQEVEDLMASSENPAMKTITKHELGSPTRIDITAPRDRSFFNAWVDLPHNPMILSIQLVATLEGDTFQYAYYQIDNGTQVVFDGLAIIPTSTINSNALDGSAEIKATAVDSNGTKVSELIVIYVAKSFWQTILGSVGSFFFTIVFLVAGFFTLCGIATIKKRHISREPVI